VDPRKLKASADPMPDLGAPAHAHGKEEHVRFDSVAQSDATLGTEILDTLAEVIVNTLVGQTEAIGTGDGIAAKNEAFLEKFGITSRMLDTLSICFPEDPSRGRGQLVDFMMNKIKGVIALAVTNSEDGVVAQFMADADASWEALLGEVPAEMQGDFANLKANLDQVFTTIKRDFPASLRPNFQRIKHDLVRNGFVQQKLAGKLPATINIASTIDN